MLTYTKALIFRLLNNYVDVETYINNKQAYIHASFHHPPGVSKGVAIGKMKRYLHTNSRIETFNAFQKRHRFNLCKRGYSLSFANHHIDKVKFLDRSFELKRKIKTKHLKYRLSPDIHPQVLSFQNN